MATPPLPDVNAVRVRTTWSTGGSGEMGVRFYLSYAAAGPASGADLTTLAGDIGAAYSTHMLGLWASNFTITEIDVLDISTEMGAAGTDTTARVGSRVGNTLSDNCATNVEFDIAERYRGGKPRFYLPPGVTTDMATVSTYGSTFTDLVGTDVGLFFSEITAVSLSTLGTLKHILLSYYKGVDKNQPPTGRWRGPGTKYPPLYRTPNAVHFNVIGYAPKSVIGSQRKRRTATTP